MSAYDDASARLSQVPATPYYNLGANSVANPGGLGGYGHRTAFFALLTDILTVASYMLSQATAFLASVTAQAGIATTKAGEAAASAATALNAPGTAATSVSPNDITGAVGTTKTFVIQTGKSIVPGMRFIAARTSAPATQNMTGTVQSYVSGTGNLQIVIDAITGAGLAITDWTLSLTAAVDVSSLQARTERGAANGYAPLDAASRLPVANLPANLARDSAFAVASAMFN